MWEIGPRIGLLQLKSRVVGLTGFRGVLGSNIVEFLKSDESVKFSLFDGDIRDREAAREWAAAVRPDTVINLAAIVPIAVVDKNRESAISVNTDGPSVFLQGLLEGIGSSPIRFLQVSTCHVYGSSEMPINEEAEPNPQNFYARTKLEGEIKIHELVQAHPNVDLVVPRVFGVYSRSQHHSFLYPALLRKIDPGVSPQTIDLPGANNVRDFLHASRTAELIVEIEKSGQLGIINVGSGKGLTVKDFAESIFDVELVISEAEFSTEPTSLVADVTLLRNAIGSRRFDQIIENKAPLD